MLSLNIFNSDGIYLNVIIGYDADAWKLSGPPENDCPSILEGWYI